jgi:hypothetical protein
MGKSRKRRPKSSQSFKKPPVLMREETQIETDPLKKFIDEKVALSVRSNIYSITFIAERRYREHENLVANFMALQTLLARLGVIKEEDFRAMHRQVMEDNFGYIDDTGTMPGFLRIETYGIDLGVEA